MSDPVLEVSKLTDAVFSALIAASSDDTDEVMYFVVLTLCLCTGAVEKGIAVEALLDRVRETYATVVDAKRRADGGAK